MLFSLDVSAPSGKFSGTAMGRLARATTLVMFLSLRLWRITSVAQKPVPPETMSFMIGDSRLAYVAVWINVEAQWSEGTEQKYLTLTPGRGLIYVQTGFHLAQAWLRRA